MSRAFHNSPVDSRRQGSNMSPARTRPAGDPQVDRTRQRKVRQVDGCGAYFNMSKLTKQGLRDLNARQFNGRQLPSRCVPHVPGPLERLGTRLRKTPLGSIEETDEYGCRCIKCGEVVGPTV